MRQTRSLRIEPHNLRAVGQRRRILIIKGSFWSWHCPCCYMTAGGFVKHADALWEVGIHLSVWHTTKEQRKQ